VELKSRNLQLQAPSKRDSTHVDVSQEEVDPDRQVRLFIEFKGKTHRSDFSVTDFQDLLDQVKKNLNIQSDFFLEKYDYDTEAFVLLTSLQQIPALFTSKLRVVLQEERLPK